jgi:hypothetical protein
VHAFKSVCFSDLRNLWALRVAFFNDVANWVPLVHNAGSPTPNDSSALPLCHGSIRPKSFRPAVNNWSNLTPSSFPL